ncbi:MAG: VWA domain-containing protein [Flavobacteriaceae bacterium]|nr:VWA domain-containing protein [Flavobacteriaceae bacterium]
MKTFILVLAHLLTLLLHSQNSSETSNPKTNDSLTTQSVVEKKIKTISSKAQDVFDVIIDELIATDKTQIKNITFLVEVGSFQSASETKVLLKQGIRVLAKKLTPNDQVAIVTYGKSSKTLITHTPLSSKSAIIKAINRLSIESTQVSLKGIEQAYKLAEDNYNEKAENIVVLLRDDAEFEAEDIATVAVDNLDTRQAEVKKQKNATILITAISLIPEIIRIIK